MQHKEWNFGTDKELAAELQSLVLKGKKTATCGLFYEESRIPKIGDIAYIKKFDGQKLCAIEYTNVRVIPFLEVDYDFAQLEGEGYKDIEEWRESHRKYFTRENGEFDENSLMVCEEFKVVDIF